MAENNKKAQSPKVTRNESNRSNLTLVIGVLVIALLIGYYTQSPLPTQSLDNAKSDVEKPKRTKHSSWSTENGIIKHKVERVKWAPHVPFAKQMLKLREPTILTNTIVSQWKAIQKWGNPEYLATHPALSQMTGVQIGSHNTFGFIDKKTSLAKANLPDINLIPNYIEVNMTNQEFFSRINDTNDDNYYYWYGKVEGDLKNDVAPSEYIWADSEDRVNFGLFMWLSGNDTRPPIHYDQDHNFFVHVSGIKRFVLFPPWEWRKLYPFPRTHPKWHKSQCSFDAPDLEKLVNYKDAEAWEAVLNPGEVLYLPPYWWHHVESVTASVSLASWSQSGVYRMLKAIYERNLEIDKETNLIKRKAMAKAFVELLLERIYGKGQVKPFIKSMIESRWAPIKETFEKLESYRDEHFCDKDNNVEQFKNLLNGDIEFIVERMNACQGYEISIKNRDVQAIRDLEVCDYIETIVSDVFGAQNAYKFFVDCLLL